MAKPKPLRKNITISKQALKQAKELKAAGYASTRSGVIARAVDEAWGAKLKKSPRAAVKPRNTLLELPSEPVEDKPTLPDRERS